MAKYIVLIRSNLRKAKGQTAAEFVLILLAAAMMNLWLMLSLDYRQNFDRCHQRLNAEHVAVCAADNSEGVKEYISQILEEDSRTAEYYMDDVMWAQGSIPYNGGEAFTNFLMMDKQSACSRPIGKIEFVEESECAKGVFLPMIFKTGELAVGKNVSLTIGNHKLSYQICGFFNSAMAGSHNCGICEILLTKEAYQELEGKGYAQSSTLVSVRLLDKSGSEEFEAMLNHKIAEKYPNIPTTSNSYALVSQSRYISQMICSGVISAMACFVLLIILVVVASNIINYIQENMGNLGVWKAAGYQSRQLMGMLQLQFVSIAVVAAIFGMALSYAVFPGVNNMMVSQTGIPYKVHMQPALFLITLSVLCSAVAVTVWLPSRRIKKIPPIDALRQGVQAHSFQRNHIPLDRAKLPLNAALALKTTLSGMKYNVTICITMSMLSLIIVFSGLMLENLIMDVTPFLNLVAGETADASININAGAEKEFLEEMEKDSRVEKVYLYHTQKVGHIGGAELIVNICDDFSKVSNQEVVVRGRFPEFDNEVAVAIKYAREQGWELGDEIRLGIGGKETNYLITGFTQLSNNLGKDCLLTRAGYGRIGGLDNLSYYMDLSEGIEIEAFNKELSRKFGKKANQTQNINEVIHGISVVYISLMTVIVVAILLLSALIIMFVIYLLVRAILNRKRKEYGILKSLGFTTAQLVVQTALSFMPAVVASTVVGLVGSCYIINPLTAIFLRDIGIVYCSFRVPVGFVAAAGLALIAFAFLAACLMSLRIRKIAPRSLLA